MGMKEILEAKRLAAASQKEAVAPAVAPAKEEAVVPASDPMGLFSPEKAPVNATVEVATKPEPEAPPKVMTFAEKMAAKKAALAAEQNPATEKMAVSNIAERIGIVAEQLAPIGLTDEQQAQADSTDDADLAQAYTDIAMRLNMLAKTSDEADLKNSMSELKKALHKNPAVALLVLDSDIGQMVIALRKLTQTELEEQSAPKTRATGAVKKKQVLLTAAETAAAWDEL